jgi:hypothetical protein
MITRRGNPTVHPKIKEHVILTMASARITWKRPNRSDRAPMEKEAIMPMT